MTAEREASIAKCDDYIITRAACGLVRQRGSCWTAEQLTGSSAALLHHPLHHLEESVQVAGFPKHHLEARSRKRDICAMRVSNSGDTSKWETTARRAFPHGHMSCASRRLQASEAGNFSSCSPQLRRTFYYTTQIWI